MYTVLLSGGSGKRLWPLSNSLRSKQYIKLLRREDGGDTCSMVQRVWSQLQTEGLTQKAAICASKGQVEILTSQLGPVSIAVEPSRRDTFPAAALSCAYLKSRMGATDEDMVCFLPVDPYTEKAYFETLRRLPDVLDKTGAEVALMGVVPGEPSTQYGYIVPKNGLDGGFALVEGFYEKPEQALAEELIRRGAVWNCGVFCLRIGTVLDRCRRYVDNCDYDTLFAQYDKLPKISFDYEVLEKAERLAVTAFSGMWKDLGTWNSLSGEMSTHTVGQVVMGPGCDNTHVVNELSIPVVTMGMRDVVVAASFDGILIADKRAAETVKNVVEKLDFSPKYEERRWGTIKVIDVAEEKGRLHTTRKITLFESCNSSYHFHNERDEVWTILEGNAEVVVNGIRQLLSAGDVLRIPSGTKHAVRALTTLEFIEIQFGQSIADRDLNRITLSWDDIDFR